MPSSNIFSWKDGLGWLVLSGGNEPTGAVRASAIERIAADGALACISFGGDDDDLILNDLQDLGAPTGYLVDVISEDDDTILDQLGAASLIAISHNVAPSQIRSNLIGAPLEAIQTAYERGAVILAEAQAATVFGAYLPDGKGFGWLSNSYVVPGLGSAAESDEVRRMVADYPDVIIMAPAVGAAMVFGGNGTLETWGNQQVTIALGNAYTSD
jgi:hypothetical protein